MGTYQWSPRRPCRDLCDSSHGSSRIPPRSLSWRGENYTLEFVVVDIHPGIDFLDLTSTTTDAYLLDLLVVIYQYLTYHSRLFLSIVSLVDVLCILLSRSCSCDILVTVVSSHFRLLHSVSCLLLHTSSWSLVLSAVLCVLSIVSR